jgi:hypothetical protein
MRGIVADFLVRSQGQCRRACDRPICRHRRRELRRRDQSPFGPTPGFNLSATDANASALVSVRRRRLP